MAKIKLTWTYSGGDVSIDGFKVYRNGTLIGTTNFKNRFFIDEATNAYNNTLDSQILKYEVKSYLGNVINESVSQTNVSVSNISNLLTVPSSSNFYQTRVNSDHNNTTGYYDSWNAHHFEVFNHKSWSEGYNTGQTRANSVGDFTDRYGFFNDVYDSINVIGIKFYKQGASLNFSTLKYVAYGYNQPDKSDMVKIAERVLTEAEKNDVTGKYYNLDFSGIKNYKGYEGGVEGTSSVAKQMGHTYRWVDLLTKAL